MVGAGAQVTGIQSWLFKNWDTENEWSLFEILALSDLLLGHSDLDENTAS